MVDLGLRKDESALPDRPREPDLGAASTGGVRDHFWTHGPVGQVGAQHAARGRALCARHHRGDYESERGIRAHEDGGVGVV